MIRELDIEANVSLFPNGTDFSVSQITNSIGVAVTSI
jgi:hypothetical protein